MIAVAITIEDPDVEAIVVSVHSATRTVPFLDLSQYLLVLSTSPMRYL